VREIADAIAAPTIPIIGIRNTLSKTFVIAPIMLSIKFSFVLPITISVAAFGPRNTWMNMPIARIRSASAVSACAYEGPKRKFNTAPGNGEQKNDEKEGESY